MAFTIVVSGDKFIVKHGDTTLVAFTNNPDSTSTAKVVGYLPGLDEVSWVNTLRDGETTLQDPVILQRNIVTPPPPLRSVEQEPEQEIPMTRDGLLLSRAEMEEFAQEHGIPMERVATAHTRQARLTRKAHTSSVKKVDEDLRDHILREIQQSWTLYPTQSKEFVARETHRIAKDVLGDDDHTSVMRVAGVRAALARGVYG